MDEKKRVGHQAGMVLLVTLCWLVVINMMAMTVLELAKQQARVWQYVDDHGRAFYAASDAMRIVRDRLMADVKEGASVMEGSGEMEGVRYVVAEQLWSNTKRGYLVTVRSQVDHSKVEIQSYYKVDHQKVMQCWWRQIV